MIKPRVILKKRLYSFRPQLSPAELANLGTGKIVYIRKMGHEKAQELYPKAELPKTMQIFVVHGANGLPIALTGSRKAAIGYAMGGKLEIAQVH